MGDYIKEILIHKIRHLKGLRIPISDDGELKHIIITGKNGSGKTSLLDSLFKFIDVCIFKYYYPDIKTKSQLLFQIVKYSDQELDKKLINLALTILKHKKIDDTAPFGINDKDSIFKGTIDWFLTAIGGLEIIFNSYESLYNKVKDNQFIISYLRAGRKTQFRQPKMIEKITLIKQQVNFSDNISKQFLQYIVNLKAERSFARDEGHDAEADQIDKWFANFESMLKKIFATDDLKLIFDYKRYTFSIQLKNREPFDLSQLSDGYSAIIQIISELILKLEFLDLKAHEAEGIVFIDELETHLHVELEKDILPILCSFFPKIQFVISTHSPFVLSSVANAIVYDLEKNEAIEDLSGYSYSAIVESYFKTDQYSDHLKTIIKEYETLLLKNSKTSEDEKQIVDLESYLDDIPKQLNKELFNKFIELKLKKKELS